MNIKVALGEVFKKLGMLKFTLQIVRKFGYLTKFTDHHSNGIDMATDMSADVDLGAIKTVFDVGASIGSMSQYFLEIFPNATVHAFEPYTPSYQALMKNFGSNPRMAVNQVGLSNQPGELKMYYQKDSGYNSLNDEVNIPSDDMDGKFEMVKINTITNYCAENGIKEIDFIKIDTEGLDLKVLQGCEELLSAGKVRYIFVECTFNNDNPQNTQFHDLNMYLQNMNFKVRAIYDQSNFGEKPYLTCVNAMFMLQRKQVLN